MKIFLFQIKMWRPKDVWTNIMRKNINIKVKGIKKLWNIFKIQIRNKVFQTEFLSLFCGNPFSIGQDRLMISNIQMRLRKNIVYNDLFILWMLFKYLRKKGFIWMFAKNNVKGKSCELFHLKQWEEQSYQKWQELSISIERSNFSICLTWENTIDFKKSLFWWELF